MAYNYTKQKATPTTTSYTRPGQYTTNNSTSAEDVESIALLYEARDHMKNLAMDNTNHGSYFHWKGFQGFKRLHRYCGREHWEYVSRINCMMVDHYGIYPEYKVEVEYVPPVGTNCLERTTEYANGLEVRLARMGEIKNKLIANNHHYAAELIQEIICDLEKGLKYTYRHINYMKDIAGDMGSLHWYSHELHEHFKEKEAKRHNRCYK